MQINSLIINNLRNIESAEISPDSSLNILYGDNGAGKTSVLESLLLLSKGKSFRTGNISSMIGPTDEMIRVVAKLQSNTQEKHQVGLERTVDQWRARMDGKDVRQFSELSRVLPLVLLEPNSHQLVSGSPDVRRRFLDWGVFHVKHRHLEDWRRYGRAIKQRNAALRIGNREMARSLDPQLQELGSRLSEGREEQVKLLAQELDNSLSVLSPGLPTVELRYYPGWRDMELSEALESSLDRDLERGITSPGPHRADLRLKLEDAIAKDRFSRGEQKLLSAALLLAQAKIMSNAGATPLLLLDDLASEFDDGHLQNVIDTGLSLNTQIWVTGTSPEPFAFTRGTGRAMFHVEHGEISVSDKR